MKIRCSLCGKFRKIEDTVEEEEHDSDWWLISEWIECKFCMSEFDLERYKFKEKDLCPKK